MTQRTLIQHWGPALAGLCLSGLAACADNLPCDRMCTPGQLAAEEPLTVEPVQYAAIFGTEWVAGVNVEGKTATAHYGEGRADVRK